MAFQIIRNDITKISADAIVNTANPEPVCGGGTDTAIYQAAGFEDLLAARKEIGSIKPGEAAYTSAFALNADYIIHTVGPVWQGGDSGEYEILASCYRNSLNLAKRLQCDSIAFPLISTGAYGFPRAEALNIAIREIRAFSDALSESEDMEITLVVFDRESFVLSGQVFDGVDAFIDGNYVEEKMQSEYFAGHMDESVCFSARNREENPNFSEQKTKGKNLSVRQNLFGSFLKNQTSKKRFALSSEEEYKEESEEEKEEWLDESTDDHYEECIEESPEESVEECLSESPVELKMACAAPRSLEDVMAEIGETWQESLLRLIDEKGYTDTQVYKKANIDRKLFSKIRSNPAYQPKKMTAVAFALALELNLDETKDFLGRAGYAFSPSNRFDLIVEYFIRNEEYDIYTINLALFDHDQPLLGA